MQNSSTPDPNRFAPIFVVGCGRSGTTLLRLMLEAHSQVAIPGESHFVYWIARMRARGKWPSELSGPGAREALITYLEGLHFHHEWRVPFDVIAAAVRDPAVTTHGEAFQAVFDCYRAAHGKKCWGDKTPMHVQYMLMLDKLIPGCRFVHIIRDARPVAQSLMTRKWGPRHISHAGHYWNWLVLSGMLGGAVLGPGRYYQLTFESLVAEKETQLRDLANWLGIGFEAGMLDYYQTESAKNYAKAGSVAQRLATPVDTGRLTFWKESLPPRDQRSIARQSGALLSHLGYEVGPLATSAQRQKQQIENILSPDFIDDLRQEVGRDGRTPPSALTAQASRTRQYADFMLGRLEPWARQSVRWQCDVAAMLG